MFNDIKFQHLYGAEFRHQSCRGSHVDHKIPMHIRRFDTGGIININNITGRMDKYELNCSDSCQAEFFFAWKKITSTHTAIMTNSRTITHAKFSTINVSPENRTIYINCTSVVARFTVHSLIADCDRSWTPYPSRNFWSH